MGEGPPLPVERDTVPNVGSPFIGRSAACDGFRAAAGFNFKRIANWLKAILCVLLELALYHSDIKLNFDQRWSQGTGLLSI